MIKPLSVKALSGYRIRIKYTDGTEGIINLSYLAGKGVFNVWQDHRIFKSVHVGSGGAVEWDGGIDLCPDALYLRLTGKSPEEIFANLKAGLPAGRAGAHA